MDTNSPNRDSSIYPLVARIAEIGTDKALQQRLELLRKKANFGTLTPDERDEYAEFVEALDQLSILKAKAIANTTGNMTSE